MQEVNRAAICLSSVQPVIANRPVDERVGFGYVLRQKMKARRPRSRSSTSAEQRRLSYLEFRTARGGSRLRHLGTRVVISLSPDPRVRFVLGWHSPSRHFHLRAVDADQCPRLVFRFGQVVVGRRLVDIAACDPPVDVVPLAIVARFKKISAFPSKSTFR